MNTNKLKKLISIFLVALTLSLLAVTSVGCAPEKETYTLLANGTYKVNATLEGTKVEIPATYNDKPVTEIGADAFRGNSTVKEIVLPDTVKKIGASAFQDVKSLSKINLDKVEEIGKNAFKGAMSNLKAIPDPVIIDLSAVTNLGDGAFSNCTALSMVTLGTCVSEVTARAFNGCDNLYQVVLADTITKIGTEAFNGCVGLKNINVDKITFIDKRGFQNCAFTEINLPSIEVIKDQAFFSCGRLSKVVLGNNVKQVYFRAFEALNLTEFSIGNGSDTWYYFHQSSNTWTNGSINYFENTYVNTTENGVSVLDALKNPSKASNRRILASCLATKRNPGSFMANQEWIVANGITQIPASFPWGTFD